MLAQSRSRAVPKAYPTKVVDEAAYRLPFDDTRVLVIRRAVVRLPGWGPPVQFVLHFSVFR
jgi:hypothetical protein